MSVEIINTCRIDIYQIYIENSPYGDIEAIIDIYYHTESGEQEIDVRNVYINGKKTEIDTEIEEFIINEFYNNL